jgi:1-acyl-sn-glycerol-3-phosphate acyltransferase
VAENGPTGRVLYRLIQTGAWGVGLAAGGVRHFNRPRAEQVQGGLLVASNHQSFFDPVLIGMAMPRRICYLARQTLFDAPGFGPLIRSLGARPVRRGAVDAEAVRTVIRLLRAGEALLMFPEGTRTQDGGFGRFSPGAAALAARCGVPVLPVCIEGAFRGWPRTRLAPRASPIAVAFGEPMASAGRTADELTEQLLEQLVEMRGFLRERLAWRTR